MKVFGSHSIQRILDYAFLTPERFGVDYEQACAAADLPANATGYGLFHCVDDQGERWGVATTDIEHHKAVVALIWRNEWPPAGMFRKEKYRLFRQGWPDALGLARLRHLAHWRNTVTGELLGPPKTPMTSHMEVRSPARYRVVTERAPISDPDGDERVQRTVALYEVSGTTSEADCLHPSWWGDSPLPWSLRDRDRGGKAFCGLPWDWCFQNDRTVFERWADRPWGRWPATMQPTPIELYDEKKYRRDIKRTESEGLQGPWPFPVSRESHADWNAAGAR